MRLGLNCDRKAQLAGINQTGKSVRTVQTL